MKYLCIGLAVVEVAGSLPAFVALLLLNAAYAVAGNGPPLTLAIGLLLAPASLIVAPVFALTRHGRENPRKSLVILLLPAVALAIAFAPEIRV